MASLIVAFPSETLEMGKALGRVPGAVGHVFVPDIADRINLYMRLENAGPVQEPLLSGLKERYDGRVFGGGDVGRWVGRVELGMENVREFPVFDLVWKLEGLIDGVFLKFEGTQGIMRLDSHKPVDELGGLRDQFQAQLPVGFKVQALEAGALPEAWEDLIALHGAESDISA